MAVTPSAHNPTDSVALVLAALNTIGWDRARCAAHLGLQRASLEPSGSIPLHTAGALVDLALEVGGAELAAHTPQIPHGALGLLDHLAAAAPTARHALADLARYFRLVAHGVRLEFEEDTLRLHLPPSFPPAHRHLHARLLFAFLEHRLQAPHGPLTPARADVWAATPSATYAAADLDRPRPHADASLRTLLDRYASEELARQPNPTTMRDQVVQVLLDRLPGAPPSATRVARALGMSDRTLRRALQAEGHRWSVVRDRCLQAVAEEALLDTERSIGEVGWLLGYSEPSAFHRAFRRWTGTTPQRFRQAGRPGP